MYCNSISFLNFAQHFLLICKISATSEKQTFYTLALIYVASNVVVILLLLLPKNRIRTYSKLHSQILMVSGVWT